MWKTSDFIISSTLSLSFFSIIIEYAYSFDARLTNFCSITLFSVCKSETFCLRVRRVCDCDSILSFDFSIVVERFAIFSFILWSFLSSCLIFKTVSLSFSCVELYLLFSFFIFLVVLLISFLIVSRFSLLKSPIARNTNNITFLICYLFSLYIDKITVEMLKDILKTKNESISSL